MNNTDPLHGKTLAVIVTQLYEVYGWDKLADRIPINCFMHDPSIKSSLTFLRKTSWARKKVEELWLAKIGYHLAEVKENEPDNTAAESTEKND
jgi:uncharacterized protein (DUF2132 family)